MNVHAAGRVAPHHIVRHPHRAAPSTTVDGPEVATTADAGSTDADGTAVGGTSGATAGPTTPGGNDTPFTHALHRGQGRKVGILRRMPSVEDVAAEQAAAGLGTTDDSDTTVNDGTAAADDAPQTRDAWSGDGAAAGSPVADVTDGTIAIDATTLFDEVAGADVRGGAPVVTDSPETIDQLRARLEDARGDELWRFPVEGPDTTEV